MQCTYKGRGVLVQSKTPTPQTLEFTYPPTYCIFVPVRMPPYTYATTDAVASTAAGRSQTFVQAIAFEMLFRFVSILQDWSRDL